MVTAALVATIGWWPTVILILLLLGLTFYLLAVVCDEALAPTLEELSDAWKIPHDVACATFLAAGSSAPEIAISLVSVVHEKKSALDLSIGALMGSALIAYTVIPAACILVSPGRELKLDLVPLARDITFFTVGLVSVIVSAEDGEVDVYESGWLVVLFFLYLAAMKLLTPYYAHVETEHHFLTTNPVAVAPENGHSKYGTVDEESVNIKAETAGRGSQDDEAEEELSAAGQLIRRILPPFHFKEEQIKNQYFWMLVISIFYISVLSELILYLAEGLSDLVGISHRFTGLVLVALGAQVPDTVASMAVAKHGEGPSSIANAIGSQVLNINLAIGLPFLVSNLVRGHAVEVVPAGDSGIMISATVLLFIAMVLLERVTLRTRNAMVLGLIYAAVIVGYGVHTTTKIQSH